MMFGDRLQQLRKDQGIDQEVLAEKLGVKKSAVSLWENNKREPSFGKLLEISRFFNVSIDYLFGKTNTKQHEDSPTSQEIALFVELVKNNKIKFKIAEEIISSAIPTQELMELVNIAIRLYNSKK